MFAGQALFKIVHLRCGAQAQFFHFRLAASLDVCIRRGGVGHKHVHHILVPGLFGHGHFLAGLLSGRRHEVRFIRNGRAFGRGMVFRAGSPRIAGGGFGRGLPCRRIVEGLPVKMVHLMTLHASSKNISAAGRHHCC